MSANGYTALTAAAIFIPLSIAAPSIFENKEDVIVKEIVVDVESLSKEERESYFYHLSYQTCIKETIKVSPSRNGQAESVANACSESVKKLNNNIDLIVSN